MRGCQGARGRQGGRGRLRGVSGVGLPRSNRYEGFAREGGASREELLELPKRGAGGGVASGTLCVQACMGGDAIGVLVSRPD